ncbi:hypothetical protein TNCV_4311581, partial [Trichonephila clavipes]
DYVGGGGSVCHFKAVKWRFQSIGNVRRRQRHDLPCATTLVVDQSLLLMALRNRTGNVTQLRIQLFLEIEWSESKQSKKASPSGFYVHVD